ncbi:MAG: hypothetical protein JOY98_05075 [Candidatus Eremiobacteraeota bacterium]|nr:hypothetical protein [Candidatus Eremiobacteraeota bacterium]
MAKPRLTEFLLRLATDHALLELYKGYTNAERSVMMQSAELSNDQIHAMLDGDDAAITQQILAELPTGATSRGGNHFTVQINVELHARKK